MKILVYLFEHILKIFAVISVMFAGSQAKKMDAEIIHSAEALPALPGH
jgi:hypothetical protein